MKAMLLNFGATLGVGLLALLGAVTLCLGFGWILNLLFLDYLIQKGAVENSSEFWSLIRTFYLILIMPPLYLYLFRMLPHAMQDNLKENAKSTAIAFIHVGDWLGKGVLFAIGFYLVAQQFNFAL
ncbi:hypothetical protein [Vibrio parahaemolyticus]|uniref:hypothetical protein n=1 Tax=Vibrio parahaemolyticus TaxID=670 RepID=UPI001110E3B8|nr:hypothetical protein [Vibrio parahaemolyticus]TMX39461.1 hypothetical protein DA098_09230 [Vibrio parahaemolyticus]TMX80473.1 hypothetical protein DA094_02750 [Vibrio parahaemolyticus]